MGNSRKSSKTADKSNRVIPIEHNSIRVKIRETPSHGKLRYTVSWQEKGQTLRKMRSTLEEAKGLANEVIRRIEDGERGDLNMLGRDGKQYQKCVEMLDGTGYTPTSAIESFKKCLDKLEGKASISDAVDSYLKNADEEIRDILIPNAVSQFLIDKKNDVCDKQWRDYKVQLNKFADSFIGPISSPSDKDLRRWIESQKIKVKMRSAGGKIGDTISNQTKRNILTKILAFYNWCRSNHYLPLNKLHAAEKLSGVIKRRNSRIWKDQEKEISILTPSQASRLVNECRDDLRVYASILLFAGLRPSEAKQLDWKDINTRPGYIYVRSNKTGKNRYVEIQKNLSQWLEPFMQESGPITYKTADTILAQEAIDLEIVDKSWPNDVCRHSYASYRLAIIESRNHLADELGDSVAVVNKHYRVPITKEEGEEYFSISPRH